MTTTGMNDPEPRYRVLYLDLDGTVRKGFDELGRFVNSAADVEVFTQVPAIMRRYKTAGWKIAAVTNQGGVSLGIVSLLDARAAALETNKQCGNLFDTIVMCIHHPQAEDPEYAHCWCRKPRYGGVIEAAYNLARKWPGVYPPHRALFVGDRPEDQQCAEGAGITFQWAQEWRNAPFSLDRTDQ